MIVEPFRPDHLKELPLQLAQAHLSATVAGKEYAAALSLGEAYAALIEGRPVACAGLVEMWPGRAIAWALLSRDAGPHFLKIHRAVARMLDLCPCHRVEAYADAGFPAASRWLETLGFAREGVMRAFTADRRDCFLYARIR